VFVTSRVDYCGSLLIGSPKMTTKKLQCVLNSVARIVSNTHKFERGLTHFWRSELHWLDVVDRVRFRVYVQVFRYSGVCTTYLSTLCQPLSSNAVHRSLRLTDRGHLDCPHVRLATYSGRAFALIFTTAHRTVTHFLPT